MSYTCSDTGHVSCLLSPAYRTASIVNAQTLTPDELIDFIARHQVIEPDELWQYLANQGGAAGLPAEGALAVDDMVRSGLLTEYQGAQVLVGNAPGLQVGKYRLLARLGPAESTAHLAERKPDGARVVVKLLAAEESAHPGRAERFRREAEALARLEHPGVVAIKDTGTACGRPFLVTEYLEGMTLDELVAQQGALMPVAGVRIVHEAARIIDYVHNEGLLHGDLHPGHVLVDEQGGVHILDLGQARPLGGKGEDRPSGPPGFHAPEQRAGSQDLDARADVYALGALLWFLLTGQVPPEETPEPLDRLCPQVPEWLADVVKRMLAADPTRRYASAAEVARELGVWLHHVSPPTVKTPAPPPPPAVVCIETVDGELTVPAPAPLSRERPVEGGLSPWVLAALAFGLGTALFAVFLALGKLG